jgi:hypothetical protein
MPLALLLFVFFLQGNPTISQSGRPSRNHGAASANSQNPQNPAQKRADPSDSSGIAPNTYNVTNRDRQESDAEKMEERRDRKTQLQLNRIYVGVSIIGVVGAWIGLIVLICQTLINKTSADAAKASADAANKSAVSVMDSERAWVIASPIQNAPEVGFIPPPTGQPELDGVDTPNSFSVAFKNSGKTPALLIDSAVVYRLFNSLQEIPTEPEYGTRGPLNGLPLVTGDSIGAFAFLQPNAILTYDVAQAVWRQRGFLCAYGIVAYQDVFYRTHETRFGYVYHFPLGGDPIPAGFRRERLPSAYNRAT